ncbi:hypothetical protein RN001_003824 [Aquatica leii]|uniref:Dynactin subunit 5 n=1 Tax=Aquatica leii TaxID=1421715 RepID=A0AAN7QPB2_9COLE|nr:hypothetical protein RN001_003824 [Aquatica leii]
MEMQDITYDKSEYVETASGNKVSRKTVLCGSQNIVLQGEVIIQSDAILRGDLANVRIGRYCIVSKETVIRPPYKKFGNSGAFFPITIGDNVYVGKGAAISAAIIGSYVYIGKDVVIGRACVLKDCCIIEDNAIIAPETTIPPFTKYGGSPGTQVGSVPECQQDLMIDFTRSYYQHFVPLQTL